MANGKVTLAELRKEATRVGLACESVAESPAPILQGVDVARVVITAPRAIDS
jgi:hypothetical protein